MRTKHRAEVSVRLRFADDARIGPGKIALLEGVGRSGSIAATERDMNMSYRRAWLLIDSLSRMFDEPVVFASPGGGERRRCRAESRACRRARSPKSDPASVRVSAPGVRTPSRARRARSP
jgi:molybdate transport system regulatory protein